MKKQNIIILAIVVVCAIIFTNACSSYNSMVNLDEDAAKAWANVENAYQRRMDLIPNLVNTVKGYAAHESQTLEAVTAARAGLMDAYNNAKDTQADPASAESVKSFQQAQEKLNSQLGIYVNAVHEAYPDLKANENFMNLQTQLEGTENRIATERNRYNEAVKQYNVKIRRFPNNIYASVFGFDRRSEFQAQEGAQYAPKVEF